MSVAGSAELASFLGESVLTQKVVNPCTTHNLLKELFHPASKTTGCQKCFIEKQTMFNELVDAREYCSKVMERFIDILDNATYMPNEHIQKEKEYGIPWRTAFKEELTINVSELSRKTLGNQEQDDKEHKEDPFATLHTIIKKDVIDAATLDTQTQAEHLSLMVDQLEILEKSVHTIKCLLKQPYFLEFENTKQSTLNELRVKQTKFNPSRPDSAALDATRPLPTSNKK